MGIRLAVCRRRLSLGSVHPRRPGMDCACVAHVEGRRLTFPASPTDVNLARGRAVVSSSRPGRPEQIASAIAPGRLPPSHRPHPTTPPPQKAACTASDAHQWFRRARRRHRTLVPVEQCLAHASLRRRCLPRHGAAYGPGWLDFATPPRHPASSAARCTHLAPCSAAPAAWTR
jgi:hypothetical protein